MLGGEEVPGSRQTDAEPPHGESSEFLSSGGGWMQWFEIASINILTLTATKQRQTMRISSYACYFTVSHVCRSRPSFVIRRRLHLAKKPSCHPAKPNDFSDRSKKALSCPLFGSNSVIQKLQQR